MEVKQLARQVETIPEPITLCAETMMTQDKALEIMAKFSRRTCLITSAQWQHGILRFELSPEQFADDEMEG